MKIKENVVSNVEISQLEKTLTEFTELTSSKLRFLLRKFPTNWTNANKVSITNIQETEDLWADLDKSLGRSDINHCNYEIYLSKTKPDILYFQYYSSNWAIIKLV